MNMGWWNTSRDGTSFALDLHKDGSPMIWGDGPSDLIDAAVQEIIAMFREDLGRAPSLEELIAGLKFSALGLEEGELADAPSVS
jgi:hypothetical protein